jgi:hypothetical protein
VRNAHPQSGSAGASAPFVDHEGHPTDSPAAAISAQALEYDSRSRPVRRTRFFMAERELPWLPVSEPAFLLWVLALFVVVWLLIGVLFQVT